MTDMRTEVSRESALEEARRAQRNVLARWGLTKFDAKELSAARSELAADGGLAGLAPEDIEFQAAVNRLKSRRNLTAADVERAIKELLAADYACDEAAWERDCEMALRMEHEHWRRALRPRSIER
ncbi:MAG: hypothetical protein ACE15C_17415 [Phycisphaerae bacterium]